VCRVRTAASERTRHTKNLKNATVEIPPRYRIANLQKWRTPGSQSIFELSTFGLISVINHLAQQPCIQTVLDTTIVLLQVQAGVALNTAASERTRHTKNLKNANVEIPPTISHCKFTKVAYAWQPKHF
jgi:hypothetical protein